MGSIRVLVISAVLLAAAVTPAEARALDCLGAAKRALVRLFEPPPEGLGRTSSPAHYQVYDRRRPYFYADGMLKNDGELQLIVEVKSGANRSPVLRGQAGFDEILAHFGDRVKSVVGSWQSATKPDNLNTFNHLVREHGDLKRAAAGTWTGKQAARHGFTEVEILHTRGRHGHFSDVRVRFTRPSPPAR